MLSGITIAALEAKAIGSDRFHEVAAVRQNHPPVPVLLRVGTAESLGVEAAAEGGRLFFLN